jgi:hypothetical protein
MKIFWSWQSDTPGDIGRFLVRDALRAAIERLRQAEEIEEAMRDDLHLDHDIQGTTGSPDLARTILEKIENSEVVIADVTIVGKTNDDKKLVNSNVAIELGYALHACSDARVILVFNQHYGKYDDLPFDLRHKGGAVVFDLSPEATRHDIEAERKSLADQFERKLKPLLQLGSRIKEPLLLRAVIEHRLERRYQVPGAGNDDVFLFQARIENIGELAATDFKLDVDIPGEIVDGSLPYGLQVQSDKPGFVRLSVTNLQSGVQIPILHPEGKTPVIMMFNYAIRDGSRPLTPEEWAKQLVATLYSGNMRPQKKTMSLAELSVVRTV